MMLWRRSINMLQNYAQKNVSAIGLKRLIQIDHPLTGRSVVARSSISKMFSGSTASASALQDVSQTPNRMAHSSYTGNSDDRIRMNSLQDMVLENFHKLEADDFLNLIRETLRILVHKLWGFHYRGIIHGNLKPQNVLMDNGECTFTSLVNDGSDSFGWKAPEQLLYNTQTTKASDMFSLGCVLYFCITGGCHPSGDDPNQRNESILKNKVNLSHVEDMPEAFDLISLLLSPKPEMRPKVNEVANHPFFQDLYWKAYVLEIACSSIDEDLLEGVTGTVPTLADPMWRKSVIDSSYHIRNMFFNKDLKRGLGSPRFFGSYSRTTLRLYQHHKDDEWFEDFIFPEDYILQFEHSRN